VKKLETLRINPRIPKSLAKELKGECEANGIKMEFLVTQAIRELLDRRKQAAA
jgi:hypothetical protein